VGTVGFSSGRQVGSGETSNGTVVPDDWRGRAITVSAGDHGCGLSPRNTLAGMADQTYLVTLKLPV
jgi:hypothetical protein